MSRAWIELDRDALRGNVKALSGLVHSGCRLMPAVKANAYGHGAVPVARELNRLGIRAFCVASADEGVELRRNGIVGEILVLGYTHPRQFGLLKTYGLTQTVMDASYARLLDLYGRTIDVHIGIDTGMHRLGEDAADIDGIRGIFDNGHLHVTGMFTHLCADETTSPRDAAFTARQGERFRRVVEELEQSGLSCGERHILASYGLLNYPELGGDLARVGIAMYGVLSEREHLDRCPVELRPVLSVKARVAQVRTVRAGDGAGYDLQYTATRDGRLAVLSIGYADGIPRGLSCGGGSVLLHGHKVPIVGRMCMDQTLVDVTDVPDAREGDVAVLIGRSGENEITAYDVAEATGTITNEVLSRLGPRLERIMVDRRDESV